MNYLVRIHPIYNEEPYNWSIFRDGWCQHAFMTIVEAQEYKESKDMLDAIEAKI